MSKRMNFYLSDEAVEVLKQQDNMSKFVNRLILKGDKYREIEVKNKTDSKVKESVKSLLDF